MDDAPNRKRPESPVDWAFQLFGLLIGCAFVGFMVAAVAGNVVGTIVAVLLGMSTWSKVREGK